jgi:predicted membrane channel-forming protein YqfA (hemolysin III family)
VTATDPDAVAALLPGALYDSRRGVNYAKPVFYALSVSGLFGSARCITAAPGLALGVGAFSAWTRMMIFVLIAGTATPALLIACAAHSE